MLSAWQKDNFNNRKFYAPPPKLISNLQPKTNYVMHYRNLQLYLSLGMQLKKVIYNLMALLTL